MDQSVRSFVQQADPSAELFVPSIGADVLLRAHGATPGAPLIRIIGKVGIERSAAFLNDALEVAEGEFLLLLTAGEELAPGVLAELTRFVQTSAETDILYTDEVHLDELGRATGVFEKPEFSPERLRHQPYIRSIVAIRADLLRSLGGFSDAYPGAAIEDAVLRATEATSSIRRVAVAGCIRPVRARDEANTASVVAATQSHLDRVGISATALPGPAPGLMTIDRGASFRPKVSIIVPTRGDSGFVWGEERRFVTAALESCLARTELDPEVVVVYDTPAPAGLIEDLQRVCGERLVLVPYEPPFNFSEKCNRGVLASSGDVIVFLNDDVQAIAANWLEQLVAPLAELDVGMTGAKLLYTDGTLQHGGHIYDPWPNHAWTGRVPSADVEFGALAVNREASGVTAACAAMRRDVFDDVGGFCRAFPVNYNDVDLSLKVASRGLRILWMAGACLYHFESKTREAVVAQWEMDLLVKRWPVEAGDSFAPTGSARRI